MATATDTTPATPDTAARGFPGLPCLHCGETDSTLLHLGELTFRCQECQTEHGIDEVRDILGQWQAVVAWCALAPLAVV